MSPRSYLRLGAGTALALATSLALFQIALDATGVLHTRLAPSTILPALFRVDVGGAEREVKALEWRRLNGPLDVMFLGSSRTQFAFDPQDYPQWRSYNFATRGARMVETSDMLSYALQYGPRFKRVIWASDFWEHFGGDEIFPREVDSPFLRPHPFATSMRLLLSYDMARRSVNALGAGLAGALKPVFETNGFYRVVNAPAYAAPDFVEAPNLRNWFDPALILKQARFQANLERGARAMTQALKRARAQGIAIDIVLLPEHVSRRALYAELGLAEAFDQWKQRMADIVAEAQAAPGAGDIRAFDFNLIGPIALSTFQAARFSNPFFFESLHVRENVARAIVRFIDRQCAEPDLVGRPLAQSLAPAAQDADRQKLADWSRAHEKEIADIRSVFAPYARAQK